MARGRKPAPAIPYVVKEGTHPLAETQTPAPIIVPPARAADAAPGPGVPVASALTAGPPGLRRRMAAGAAAAAAAAAAGEPVEKSLDEVILAYLAQGGEGER